MLNKYVGMIRFLKIFATVVGTCLVLISVIIFVLRVNIINNLQEKRNTATQEWNALSVKIIERTKQVSHFADTVSITDSILDSLKTVGAKAENDFSLFRGNADPELTKNQYLINKLFMKISAKHNKSVVFLHVNRTLKNNENVLNQMIDNYNSYVREYNVYLSTFPNFFFAKSNGFRRLNFFEIKFGENNEDPIEKRIKMLNFLKESEGE